MSSGNMLTRPSHIIALCSMANFINSADRVIMPIAIVPMADEFKWDLHGQGWVLSSFAVGYMSSQVTITESTVVVSKIFMKPMLVRK